MRMRRAQEIGDQLAGAMIIVGVLAFAVDEADIFLAADRLTDAELPHCHTSLDWNAGREPKPTMLWRICRAGPRGDEGGASPA